MVTVLGSRGMLGSVVARRWAELGDGDFIVNCIRPDNLLLTFWMAERFRLIQPSTDAIAEDSDYSLGKRIIERAPAVIIRSGIVDITRQPPVAYRDWVSNPLTPLEWADLAWEVRDQPGVHIEGREPVSRYEIGMLVAELWDRPAPSGEDGPYPLSRVQPGSRRWPPLREALIAYREWSA